MGDLAKQLQHLSPEKRELFELLLKEKREQKQRAAAMPIVRRTADSGELPLSFGQQRLWFLDQWEPGNPAYNLLQAIRLKGHLHIGALQQSLNDICAAS